MTLSDFSYHSGSTGGIEAEAVAPEAELILGSSFLPRTQTAAFTISYATERYRPAHLVTIRTNVDGWARDLYGEYRDGSWRFVLERERYPDGLQMKFLLDGVSWMEGFDVPLASDRDHAFSDEGCASDSPPSVEAGEVAIELITEGTRCPVARIPVASGRLAVRMAAAAKRALAEYR
jgi:hypothetical protein